MFSFLFKLFPIRAFKSNFLTLFVVFPERKITDNIQHFIAEYMLLPFFNTKHSFLKNFFIPSTIIEWNKLDINLWNSRSLFIFKKHILKFIQPSSNSVYNSHNGYEVEFKVHFSSNVLFSQMKGALSLAFYVP